MLFPKNKKNLIFPNSEKDTMKAQGDNSLPGSLSLLLQFTVLQNYQLAQNNLVMSLIENQWPSINSTFLQVSLIIYTGVHCISSTKSYLCNCRANRVLGPHHVPILLTTVWLGYHTVFFQDLEELTEKIISELRSRGPIPDL